MTQLTRKVSETSASLAQRFWTAVLAFGVLLTSSISIAQAPPATHFKVLYSFTGGKDGAFPAAANLIQGADGDFYGTTVIGGDLSCSDGYGTGCGVVFKVTRHGKEKVLHRFNQSDGASPYAGVIQDTEGNLYGTTKDGGVDISCCGVVFKLDAADNYTVLYRFTGGTDGAFPLAGLTMDSAGNLYGTTDLGGNLGSQCGGAENGCGVVFKVDQTGNETVLYAFTGSKDGYGPEYGSLAQDASGNLYGITSLGGDSSCPISSLGCGVVFKLDTNENETVLHSFTGGTDGANPNAGVILDAAGNLYGSTTFGGNLSCIGSSFGCGVVFKLTPAGKEKERYSFTGGTDGGQPYYGQLTQDSSGSLYGVAYNGGDSSCGSGGCGVVYKVESRGREKALYAFTGYSSWIAAYSGVIRDAAGHLYGTTARGGNLSDCSGNGCGTVYEVAP